MDTSAPTFEPKQINSGDSLAWSRSFDRYSPAEGWALTYELRNFANKISVGTAYVVADTTLGGFGISVPASVTKTWQPGDYGFAAILTNSTDDRRVTLPLGTLTILADVTIDNTLDTRSHALKMLTAIRALLEGRAEADVQEYTIQGRMLRKMTVKELQEWERTYAWRVARENGTAPKFYGHAFRRP